MEKEEVREVIQETLQAFLSNKEATCRCSLDMKVHREHHTFIEKLIESMDRINHIKWGVLQAVVIAALMGIFLLIGTGILAKLGG